MDVKMWTFMVSILAFTGKLSYGETVQLGKDTALIHDDTLHDETMSTDHFVHYGLSLGDKEICDKKRLDCLQSYTGYDRIMRKVLQNSRRSFKEGEPMFTWDYKSYCKSIAQKCFVDMIWYLNWTKGNKHILSGTTTYFSTTTRPMTTSYSYVSKNNKTDEIGINQ